MNNFWQKNALLPEFSQFSNKFNLNHQKFLKSTQDKKDWFISSSSSVVGFHLKQEKVEWRFGSKIDYQIVLIFVIWLSLIKSPYRIIFLQFSCDNLFNLIFLK